MAFAETYLSPEEYLERERFALEKSEYFNGQIYAMAGASPAHGAIVQNCSGILWSQLFDKPCRAWVADQRVQIVPTGAFVYPDVVVACDPEFDPDRRENLVNPVAIFEVLSRSTEMVDRGAKWEHYQRIPTLQHYLLIAQDQVRVEHYRRHAECWLLSVATDLEVFIELDAIGCRLSVAQIYHQADFSAAGRELK